ncbi:TonB-dependent receptor domain-containing protein [Bacteroidota bacterium]
MKKQHVLFLFFALSFGLTKITFGQNFGGVPGGQMPMDATITGAIYDPDLAVNVEYATIALYSLRDSSLVSGTISQVNGTFSLSGLPYGRFYAEVTFIGYEKKTLDQIILTPRQKELNIGIIELRQSSMNLNEVEITAEKTHIEYKIDKKVINVGQDIIASGGTAVEVLENTPSVEVDIDGNVSLRGSSNFTVLIDGKPSVLSGSDALKQIPASSIDKIEIITNPSAKYDPDGMAGILNIILKKQKAKGFNGIINLSAGLYQNYSADILLNYRTGKINFFAGGNYGVRNHPGSWELDRQTTFSDTVFHMLANSDRGHAHNGYSVKAGIEYDINKSHYMSLTAEKGLNGSSENSEAFYNEYTTPATLNTFYLRESDEIRDRDYLSLNYFYQYNFKKKGKLEFNTFYSNGSGIEDEDLSQYSTDAFWNKLVEDPYLQRTSQESSNDKLRVKADYSTPIGAKGKLEAGLQSRNESSYSIYDFSVYDYGSKVWAKDSIQHNDLDFSTNIYSGYTTYSSAKWGFEYMAGIRLEYYDRLIVQNVMNDRFASSQLDYFPSIHISRKLKHEQQLLASYSRKIERPREWYLDPFPNYVDQYNIRMGNPRLDPEYVNSYEFSYQKRLSFGVLTGEVYYRETNNKINRIAYLTDSNVMIHTFENIDQDYALGVELSGNFDIAKWWQLNASGNMFNYHIDGQILESDVNQSINTWSARLNSNFKLKWGTRIQVSVFYKAPSITAQGDRDGFFFTNIGLRQELLKKKLSVSVQVRDIFKTSSHSFTSYGENFVLSNTFIRKSPFVNFSLSYTINNYKQRYDRDQMQMDFDGGDDM